MGVYDSRNTTIFGKIPENNYMGHNGDYATQAD
jgi:hypothetical protein